MVAAEGRMPGGRSTTVRGFALSLLVLLAVHTGALMGSGSTAGPTERVGGDYDPSPQGRPAAAFVENRGQATNPEVRFYFDGGDLRIGFAPGAVLFHVRGGTGGALVRASFEGANPVIPEGRGELGHRSHFFLGSDPSRWRTAVPSYGEVVYEDLYDGVDLRYRIAGGAAKYEFRLDAAVDPAMIRIAYEGADSVAVDASGGLVVASGSANLRDTAPVADQEGIPVRCTFAVRGATSVGFDCPGRDPAKGLVIDPLVYASFLGGTNYDDARAVVVDGAGAVYVTGQTQSLDFPVSPGAYDESYNLGQYDVYVAKFSAGGTALVYCTFLGGAAEEIGDALAVDAGGNVTVAGQTSSGDFPTTPGAYDRAFNGTDDAFVAKFDATGGALLFSTLLGGDGGEQAISLVADAQGNSFLAGFTTSFDFPATPGAYQGVLRGFMDGFVAEIDATGSSLVFATFLGGTGLVDLIASLARDDFGNLYVTGGTDAADYPTTPGALDTVLNGSSDAFVAKLDPTGTALLYGTYVGGQGAPSEGEFGWSIVVDAVGNAFVAGVTNTQDFPTTPGAFNRTYRGSTDGFVLKLNAIGDGLLYSTYLGGTAEDIVQGLRIDGMGRAYVVGFTASADFPTTPGALDTTLAGVYDAFAVKMNATGSGIVYSTLLGGSRTDQAYAMALDASGSVYLAGLTNSTDFPATAGAYDTSHNGDSDAFLAKVTLGFPVTVDATPAGSKSRSTGSRTRRRTRSTASRGRTTRSARRPPRHSSRRGGRSTPGPTAGRRRTASRAPPRRRTSPGSSRRTTR